MPDAARAVERFNQAHPVGTPVTYWPGARTVTPWPPGAPKREFPGRESRTRTPAWLMSEVTPAVSVEGYPGGIALTHVEARKAGEQGHA